MGKISQEPQDDPFVPLLFKLGQRDHMVQLVEEGHLYLNTLGYFKQLEDETPRSDRDEATLFYYQMDGGTIEIQCEQDWEPLGAMVGGLRFHDEALLKANVYCLHLRRSSQCKEPWTLDSLGFGDTFVLFHNPSEFLERIRRAVAQQRLEMTCGPVEYVDRKTYHGRMGAFRKFKERAGDSEFRVLVRPGVDRPLSLQLGSLADIAVLGDASKRLKLIPKR